MTGIPLDSKYKLVFMALSFLEPAFPAIEDDRKAIDSLLQSLKNS